MTPLNLTEWLESIRATGTDPAADFASEALDIIAADRTDDFHNVKDDLEKAAGQTFEDAWRMVEFFTDRHHLLTGIEDRLRAEGYHNDADDTLDRLLSDYRALQDEADALRAAVLRAAAEERGDGSDLL